MAIVTTPQPPIQWTCPCCKSKGTCEPADLKKPEPREAYVERVGVPTQIPAYIPAPHHSGFKCPTCAHWLDHSAMVFEFYPPASVREASMLRVLPGPSVESAASEYGSAEEKQ